MCMRHLVLPRKLIFDLIHHPPLLMMVLMPLLVGTRCGSCGCSISAILVSQTWYLLLYLLRQPLLPPPAVPIILRLHIFINKQPL